MPDIIDPPSHELHDAETSRPLYRDRNLQLCFGVTLMVVLGVTSITPALPLVMDAYAISPHQLGLVITAFTVPGVFLTPVMGVLADRYGRRRTIAPSLALFGVAGFLCGFAPSFGWLVALRFLQGVGAAALGALNITIIGDLYEGRRRAAALGLNASVLSLAVAAYPLLGGVLASLGWRAPFFLPVAALPLAWLVLRHLDSPEPNGRQGLREYFKAVYTGVREPQTLGLLLATAATFLVLYGPLLTYLPVHLDEAYGASSMAIGVLLAAASLTTGLAASQLGRLARVVSERAMVKFAFLLYAAACALMAHMESVAAFFLPILLLGLGQGLNMPSIQSLLTSLAPLEQRGAFMAVNGMALRLGQTLGPLLMGALYAGWGMDGVFYGGACTAVGMFALAIVLIRPGVR